MTLQDRVKALIKERGMNAHSFEMAMGFGNGYVSKLGRVTPNTKSIARIADFFGVSTDYLLSGGENMERDETIGKIPVLGVVRAGELHTEYENVLDYISSDYDQATHFALIVSGDSMQPRLQEGDLVIVRKQDTVENGELAVVQVNGDEAVVKKLLKFAHGIGLQSYNKAYPLVQYNETEIAEKPVRILGKVVEMRARL